jgi:hypothetical protein
MLGPPRLASTVTRFCFPGVRRRYTGLTTNGDGYQIKDGQTDLQTIGHVFPASGEILQRFSLQDVAGLFEVHTPTELKTADREAGTPADRWLVSIRGVQYEYEVQAAGPWLEGPAGLTEWTVAVLQQVVAA